MRKFVVATAVGLTLALGTGMAFAGDHEKHAGSKHAPVEQKIYGTVRSLPEGMIGIWIVDGKQIDVTDVTRIEEDYGKAAVGAYVEIEGTASGETLSARKIEVKSDRPRHGDRRIPRE